MKIYLDSCCLSRPYDDLTQDRISIEADAVLTILARCENDELSLCTSTVIDMELSRIRNKQKFEKAQSLTLMATEKLALTEKAKEKAVEFQQCGIKVMDSLHLAVAETSGIDVFLTTDDAFLRMAKQITTVTAVENPVTWIMEVLQNER
jgi:predicted nucleic acid-binding protein